jgi:hypothetical protein
MPPDQALPGEYGPRVATVVQDMFARIHAVAGQAAADGYAIVEGVLPRDEAASRP